MSLLVIALDGASLDLLQPWFDAGELPLLARLWREGAGGTLNSTIPWATPTAFASFATGTNPGKHGVFDFGELIGEAYTSFVPTSGAHVRGKTLWQRLGEAGKRSLVINMPMTYPAAEIDGALVAGIPYPSNSPRLCHPPDLIGRLRAHGWDLSRNASDDLAGNYAAYFDGLLDLIRTRGEATAWLIEQERPDFTAVHFLETDQVQHRYWQFMAGEPRFDSNGPHTDAILRLYKVIETAMAQIIAAAGEDALVCVMSDHGFGPTRHQVWVNNWLIKNGWMTLKPTNGVRFKQWLYRIGLSPAAIREMAPERLKLAILQFFERQKGRAMASAEKSQKSLTDKLTERLALDFYDVDWSRTLAYSTGTTAVGYIYLNVQERDPQGIVAQAAYEATRQQIADQLCQWDAVGEVLPREAVWHGDQLTHAPDLVIRWADDTTDARYFQTRISSHHLMKPVPNDYASHRPNGIFLFHGKGVMPQRIDADILDLTPTILWWLDQPVPTYMDGRVLQQCFTEAKQVTFVEEAIAIGEAVQVSAEDEAAIKQTLRGLGYLE